MRPDTREWLAGLREFVVEHRASQQPVAGQDAAAAAERMIVGAAIACRLGEVEAIRAARRRWLADREAVADGDPDPAIVLTTSAGGIAAAAGMLAAGTPLGLVAGDAVVPVTEIEYRLWCIRHPDEEHRLHVNLWNWVKTSVPRRRWPEFARHPLGEGQNYWLHREGVAGAGVADRRDCHLWRWNGSHASLLESFIRERAAPRLGGADSD